MLKNGIRGEHRAVGADYLQDYVNEYVFRYNHRDDVRPMFRAISERVSAVRDGQHEAYAPIGSAVLFPSSCDRCWPSEVGARRYILLCVEAQEGSPP